MSVSEPQPPKATSDDIFAAINALADAVEALEAWADEHAEGEPASAEPAEDRVELEVETV